MHLKEIGWKVELNEAEHICGLIDEHGETWRPNDAVTWVDFQEQLEKPGSNHSGQRPLYTEAAQTSQKGLTYQWRKGTIKG